MNDIWCICWTSTGLPPGGSSTVHIYTQTIHRTTQNKQYIEQHKKNLEECSPCPVFASYTLVFALQLRKKHGKTRVIYVSYFLFTLICSTTLFSTLNYEWAVSVTPLPPSYLPPPPQKKVVFLYSPVFWGRSLFKSKSLLHEHDAVAFLV